MKKYFFISALLVTGLLIGLINGCKKESMSNPSPGLATSFTEEFEDFSKLQANGWVEKDNSTVYAHWAQGHQYWCDKSTGNCSGFMGYSFTSTPDEFVYSLAMSPSPGNYSVSSWLITPVLSIKNGDKISFYTRGDTAGIFTDRMQVLMNKATGTDVGNTANSVGGFTDVLFDINSAQSAGAYPNVWTKYEYVFSGIAGKISTRIAFRHFVTNTMNAKGIGIDQFKFQVN